jgi:hypothetical protein
MDFHLSQDKKKGKRELVMNNWPLDQETAAF